MPRKRRNVKQRLFAVTPETLAIWRICEELLADGGGEAGGENREEYLELSSKFRLALNVKPWDHDPFDVHEEAAPPYVSHERGDESWARAWAMREAFEEAAKQAERAEAAARNAERSMARPARARAPARPARSREEDPG
jgi:hypothetical protein